MEEEQPVRAEQEGTLAGRAAATGFGRPFGYSGPSGSVSASRNLRWELLWCMKLCATARSSVLLRVSEVREEVRETAGRLCPACSCCGGVSGRDLCGQLMVLAFWPEQEVVVKRAFYGSTVTRWALVTLLISYVSLSDPNEAYVCSPVSRFVGVQPELTRVHLRRNIFLAKKLKCAAKNEGGGFNSGFFL